MNKQTRILFFLCFAPVLASCAAKESMQLNADGSGTFAMRVEVKKLFADYFASAVESSGKKGEQARIFDPAGIKERMEKRSGVKVNRAAAPNPETLEVDLSFTDIRALFSEKDPEDTGGILSFTEEKGNKLLKFHLDRKNVKQFGKLFSDLSNPAFRDLSPRKQRSSSEKEYLEAMEFLVGDEAPGILKSACVELTVRVSGEIISQSGGEVVKDAVVFRAPLLRLLLLEQPIDYAITFSKARKKTPG